MFKRAKQKIELKVTQMRRMNKFKWWTCLLPVVLLSFSMTSVAQNVEKSDKDRNYVSLFASGVMSGKFAGPDIALGGSVALTGHSNYGRGNGLGLTLGREFVYKDDKDETKHKRLSLEFWNGTVQQKNASIGLVNFLMDQKLSAQALLINGSLRVAASEQSSVWMGAGLGIGSLSHPDLINSVPGCKCLGPLKASGSVWKLQAQLERKISTDSVLSLQWAYLHLPSGQLAGVPVTVYGAGGLNKLSVGYQSYFE